MIRLLFYIILFYFLYQIGKKVYAFLTTPPQRVKGEPRKKVNKFENEDIEDVDYKEVKRKDH
jgi:hypothetical protein